MKKIMHADVVGSLLRPTFLLEAQEQLKLGKITSAELTKLEDRAVREAVRLQEEVGLDVVTDGEMRRPVFCHNFVKSVEGFRWDVPGNTVIWFDMDGHAIIDPVTVGVVAPLKKIHDMSVDEFAFLRAITDKPKKMTIPSPTMMSYYFVPGISDKVFPNPHDFLDKVTEIMKEGIDELQRQGVTFLQIDAPEFGMLLDPIQQEWFTKKGFLPSELVRKGIERINHMLKDFSGITAMHICRGNDKNRFMAKGGYETFAQEIFGAVHVDRLLLEFDSDRAGDFSPLRFVPEDKTVVLGLVTTKSPVLEKTALLQQRIEEASQFIPLERLALSTQCGFASVAKGNNMDAHAQRAKLKLVVDTAKKVWG